VKFADALAEDRRLAILKLLVEADGAANESVLRDGLRMLGHTSGLTFDAVRADLQFLADRALVRLEFFQDKIAIAHLSRRGVDVANGATIVEGVKRPSIGE
jgi:hypothetical protein